jgi:hypothetical protein
MKRPNKITAKLKTADIELAEYVKCLEKENMRLHSEIAKMQVKDVSQQNQVTALKKGQPIVNFVMDLSGGAEKKVTS